MLVFVLGALASVGAACFIFLTAVINVLCMFVMLAGTIIFGSLAHSLVPGWFSENLGLLLTNTTLSFVVTLTIMVLSTILATFGLIRRYPEWKSAE